MERALLERLDEIETGFVEVEAMLADPEVIADPSRLADLGRKHAELRGLVVDIRRLREARADLEAAKELSSDSEMAQMARDLAEEVEELEERIRAALAPDHPDDVKDVIVEIRSAAGGDEAALWAGDLYRMYQRYAERHGFSVEAMDSSPSDTGGFDKVTFAVKGRGAYSRMKHEAGVHRVQRVPRTEAQGRIHTSTATVAVLPEVEEVEVFIDPNDLRIDVYRSTGPGGQSVNTTDSAVRITHLPTGEMVTCQDEKSQLQNKEKAMRILRARLHQMELDRQHSELAGARRSQVGSGQRSEKIRTYNFKESRVTDHRIGLTIRRLEQVLEGDLDELVDALTARERAARILEEG